MIPVGQKQQLPDFNNLLTGLQIAQTNKENSANSPTETTSSAPITQGPRGIKRVLTLSDPSGKELPSPVAPPPAKKKKIDAQPAKVSTGQSFDHLINRNNPRSSEQRDILPKTPFLTIAEGITPFLPLATVLSEGNQPSSSAASAFASLASPSGLDPVAEANRCLSTAEIYKKNGQLNDAIQALQEGLNFEHSDRALKATLYRSLGCVFSDTEQYDKAIQAANDGLKIEHIDPALRAHLFNNLGYAFHATKQYDKAIPALQDGLKIEHNDVKLKAKVYFLLGKALIEDKRYAEAIPELTKGLSLCNDPSLVGLKKEIVELLIIAHNAETASSARIEQGPGGIKRVPALSDPSDKELPAPVELPPAIKQRIDAQPGKVSTRQSIDFLINQNNPSSEQGDILPKTPFLMTADAINPFLPVAPVLSEGNQPSSSAASTSTLASSPAGLDPVAEATKCLITAQTFQQNGQLDAAIQALHDGLKFEHTDLLLTANLYHDLSCTFAEAKQYDKAIQAVNDGLKIEHNDPNLKARFFLSLSCTLLNSEQFDKATQAANDGLKIEQINPLWRAQLFCNLGISYQGKKQNGMAVQAYQVGLKIKNNNQAWKVKIFRNLGLVLHDMKEFGKAIQAFQEGLEIEHNDPALRANIFNNLGGALNGAKQYDRAIQSFQDGLKFEHGDQLLKAQLCCNLGYAFHTAKQYDKAIPPFQDGLKIEHNDVKLKAKLYFLLGNALIEEKRFAEAIAELTKGLSLCNDPSLLDRKKKIVQSLIAAHTDELKRLNSLLQS